MSSERDGSAEAYVVLINAEEQYSLWRQQVAIPHGWTQVGEPGTEEACLAYIDKVWVDMRPASLRALQR